MDRGGGAGDSFEEADCVFMLEDLEEEFNAEEASRIVKKIQQDMYDITGGCSEWPCSECDIVFILTMKSEIMLPGELFRAFHAEPTVFAPLSNCFELYGIDFLVDQQLQVYLLEVNPGPDFKQTGGRLKKVIENLIEATVATVFAEEDRKACPQKLGRTIEASFTKVYDGGSNQGPGAKLRLF